MIDATGISGQWVDYIGHSTWDIRHLTAASLPHRRRRSLMLGRCSVLVALCLFLALLLAAPLSSQTFYGSVIGTVTDPSGARIPGATLTLVNAGTGERRVVVSDEEGAYRFVNLVPGSYRLEVELPGFQRYVRDQIGVNIEAAV